MNRISRFIRNEQAATAVEYAIMLLLVFLACLAAIAFFGQATAANMSESADSLETVLN